MKTQFYLTILLCLFLYLGYGQGNITKEDKNFLYRHEFSAGIKLQTNSYGIYLEKVWIKNIYTKKFIQFDLLYHYDIRQKKMDGLAIGDRTYKKFVYGKRNDIFALKFNFGYRKTIAERAMQKNGVALYFCYSAGFNLGIEKPYFLFLRDVDNVNDVNAESYNNENKDRFLNNSGTNGQIVGYAGFARGWGDIKPLFGGNLKLGLHFDWARQSVFIKSLEVGANLDVYHRSVNILATRNNKPYILNAYINFQLGKRW
jgi:hypothetical protein